MTTLPDVLSPIEFRCRRKALGLSREDLAARLRVRNATVAKWEAGRAQIPEGVEVELGDLEDLLDEMSTAYLNAGADAQLILLNQDELEDGIHCVAAARALVARRQKQTPVRIATAASDETSDYSTRAEAGKGERLR